MKLEMRTRHSKVKKGIRVSAELGDNSFKNIQKSENNNEVISYVEKDTEEYKLSSYLFDRAKHLIMIPVIVLVVNAFAIAGFLERLFDINYINNNSDSWGVSNGSGSNEDNSSGGGSSW